MKLEDEKKQIAYESQLNYNNLEKAENYIRKLMAEIDQYEASQLLKPDNV